MTQITIPAEAISVTYGAVVSTTGPFIVPFTFLNEEDVVAIVTDILAVQTVLVWNTDFTFSQLDAPVGQEGIGYTGGIIDLVVPIGADGGSSIQILRSTIVDRTANYPTTGPFDMAILNDEQNNHIAIMQELAANQASILNTTLQLVTDLGNETTNNIRWLGTLATDFIEMGASGTASFLSGGGAITQFDVLSNLDFRIAGGNFQVLDSLSTNGIDMSSDFGSSTALIGALPDAGWDLDIGAFGARWQNMSFEVASGGNMSFGVNAGNTLSIEEDIMRVNTDSGGFFQIRDDIGNAINQTIGGKALGFTPDSTDDWAIVFNDGMELRLEEKNAALAFSAGFGSLWVNDAGPNQLIFTDDVGTDHNLVALAGGITSGSFTGTLTGCTTSPTSTIFWTKITVGTQHIVFLSCPAGLEGTSNSQVMAITGIPADIRSSSNNVSTPCLALDNSLVTNRPCELGIGVGGSQLSFEIQAVADNELNGDHFTSSGNKGIGAGWSCSYAIQQI